MSPRPVVIALSLLLALAWASRPAHADKSAARKELTRPVRVLLFASGPTREYQFLRALLAQEMEAKRADVCVCLQPAPGKEPRSGIVQDLPAERVLTSFPDRVKATDAKQRRAALESYDVIVAFDPDWGRLDADTFAALREWIKNRGGKLVLIAGPINTRQLARQGVADKFRPIADLYPVTLTDIRIFEGDIDTSKPRRLTFSREAGEWSFLKLDDRGKDALAGWEEFFTGRKTSEAKGDAELRHGFFSYYPVQGVKSGAVVLATLADPKARLKDGTDQPFLVTMPVGKGRVVYLSSGETWRLRQYQAEYHKRFWLGLLASSSKPSG
jgi:hypothetical protein